MVDEGGWQLCGEGDHRDLPKKSLVIESCHWRGGAVVDEGGWQHYEEGGHRDLQELIGADASFAYRPST